MTYITTYNNSHWANFVIIEGFNFSTYKTTLVTHTQIYTWTSKPNLSYKFLHVATWIKNIIALLHDCSDTKWRNWRSGRGKSEQDPCKMRSWVSKKIPHKKAAIWWWLDERHHLIIIYIHLDPSYNHKGHTFTLPMHELDACTKP